MALPDLLQTELIIAITWAMGRWSRTRHLYTGAVEDRARLLELEREARATAAVQEERARIARELHDVVAHHVSVIVIQAGAGLHAIDRRPDAARDALAAIDATGRQALTDMRRMLGILGNEPDSLTPMPGLDELGELLTQVQGAGLPVEFSIDGERRPLDDGVELSAYRIIQEALTNVLKHAHGARAQVEIRFEPRDLRITVTDKGGRGPTDVEPERHEGRGLIGMRERVAMFGGDLEAGPIPGGFRVTARIPVRSPDGPASAATLPAEAAR